MTTGRIRTTQYFLLAFTLLLVIRLFYWQIVRGYDLSTKAENQRESTATLTAKRGDIYASDHSPLATTQSTYLLYAYKPQLNKPLNEIVDVLTPILSSTPPIASESSPILTQEDFKKQTRDYISERLNLKTSWTSLKSHVTADQKQQIESLKITGLGFDEQPIRFYPEASMSAQILGFVGNDVNGSPKGYFGLEGYYERQLQGRGGLVKQETDASGNPILIGQFTNYSSKDGRNLLTTINRSYQYHVEKLLAEGLSKYGAIEGTVIVMKPQTGAILAMASLPKYDPRAFYLYPSDTYKNPSVANLYEPGSVFKPIVMASAIDAGVVEPETICDSTCDKPVQIGSYTIRTWDDKYHPGTDMTNVLVHSDNTGMVFASRRLGRDKLHDYLSKFGFGKLTGVDLQEEVSGNLKDANSWKETEFATTSFGQGISVTSMQMLTALNAIANGGKLVQPYIVDSIQDNDTFIPIRHPAGTQVISPTTAQKVTQMMVSVVEDGEAKWTKLKNVSVAGKTGTAQIAINGHYDDKKTIASFIGFAPAQNPEFSMFVVLREPQTSPWGSETAAPLWFNIAKQLLLLH